MWRNTYSLVLFDMFYLMLEIGLDGTFLICANLKRSFSPLVIVSLCAERFAAALMGSCRVFTKNTQLNSYTEQTVLPFRSEVSKLQLPSGTRADQQLGVGSRPGQRCCLDSQHDRCSPTGRAVTTPDKSKTSLRHLFPKYAGQS